MLNTKELLFKTQNVTCGVLPAKICVIHSQPDLSGCGEEYELEADLESVATAATVEAILHEAGYDTQIYSINQIEDVDCLLESYDPKQTLVFNLCDHLGGRPMGEPEIAVRLGKLGLAYTGNSPFALLACLDKSLAKSILGANQIATARYQLFHQPDQALTVPLPAIVKPSADDASRGITRESVVAEESALRSRVRYVLETYRQPALVEEYLIGREFNISLWGNDRVQVMPLAEISFAKWPDPYQQFCHFDVKWTPQCLEYQTMPVICPAEVDADVAASIRDVAYRAYRALGCRDYARVDIRFSNGVPHVLEINPNPCIAPDSGFANAAAVAGYDYASVVNQVVSLAWQRQVEVGRTSPIRSGGWDGG